MFEITLSQELQDQLVKLSEFLPLVVIGFFMGIASLFEPEPNEDEKHKKPRPSFMQIVYHIISSIVLCVAVYSVLGYFEVDYLLRVGCACAVSFFGVDKVLSVFSRFNRAKDGRDFDHKDHR